jgi:lipoprotein-releasing system ATP-binding protein
MNDVVLELRGIHKSYNPGAANAVSVLEDVNVTLLKGQISALVAPSGAGKSTLLHISGLLDTPDSGDVYLNGTAIERTNDRRRTAARRQDIGFVYQFHHLLPEFSALENIILPQLANGTNATDAKKRAGDLLDIGGVTCTGRSSPIAIIGGRTAACGIVQSVGK